MTATKEHIIPITRKPKITFSDLHAHPGEALVANGVWIESGRPTGSIVAGLKIENRIREDGHDYFLIDFHEGGQYWVFVDEWAKIAPQRHQPMTLPNAITAFEKATGVVLPQIPVISPGVGIWEARNSTKTINPWKLEDGQRYASINRYGKRKEFLARLGEGGGIWLDTEEGPRVPAAYLGAEDWRTIRVLGASPAEERLLVGPQEIKNALMSLNPEFSTTLDSLSLPTTAAKSSSPSF
ncbi:hypothetical protein CL689_02910 [Candidatus Saccharibacteria bacterium]|nr:hypothetical protein [Candidatus Saccharibacteria bacterium]